MDMDAYKVQAIIGDSSRFISPFNEPYGYYIYAGEKKIISDISLQKYWEKLKYMSENIDILIQRAFRAEFYDFYGVNRSFVTSSREMYQQLVVDSFVLCIDNDTIESCLSNSRFMFGHFINCVWDDRWNLIYSYIC